MRDIKNKNNQNTIRKITIAIPKLSIIITGNTAPFYSILPIHSEERRQVFAPQTIESGAIFRYTSFAAVALSERSEFAGAA